ncbi:tripartite-type tricarboxylate transporter receptor subunit TctC [Cupriavidus necator]|nr:tripartite-type tricarboxylate transporter receptor subunit TctC [Cupriavidus necator]
MSAAFTETAGIRTTAVPYKATAGLLTDLIGGNVDFAMVEFTGGQELGKAVVVDQQVWRRLIAVTGMEPA